MRLVVFFGAGFSVPFGLPTMDSFLGFADGCARLDQDDRALLADLMLEARRANSFLESSPTNLEDILSFAEMGERLSLTDPARRQGERLRAIVQKAFTSITPPAQFWQQYDRVPVLLDKNPNEPAKDVAFITTNYDINLECACKRAGWLSRLPFASRRTEGVNAVDFLHHDQGIPLFKLHGSVNWFLSNEAKAEMVVEDRIVATTSGTHLPYVCTSDYAPPWTPHIVPPSFLKPEMSPPLREVWGGAARALATASTIVFVGYSFPPSDTEMAYFLARALSENTSLRKILVVDPRADDIVGRLIGPGSKLGSHFKHLLRPLRAPWQEVTGALQGFL